ncbi:polysaccharide biosynthesis C-terminal domain-containing protein [Clostridium perfringens]|nr:polysaccharide biosynthesis C-terminal domain-containing protein [Clostridium perfringens]
MSKYKKLFNNTLIFTLSNFASKLLTFLLVPLYTKLLTTSEYGVLDIISTTINLIYPLLTLTIGEAVLRFAIDKKYKKNEVLAVGIKIFLISCLVVILCIPIINNIPILSKYKYYFILYYITFSFNNLILQFLRGINELRKVAISGIIMTLCMCILNILLLVNFKLGIVGYLLAMIISNIISIIYVSLKTKILEYINFSKSNQKLLKKMLKYSIPMMPNSLSWWISNVSDRYIVTAFCGVAINGLYSVAYKIPSIMNILTDIFMQAWQLSAMEEFENKECDNFYSEVYNYYNIIIVFICSVMIIFTKIMAKVLFSNEFFIAWKFVPILLVAFIFSGLSAFLGSIYTSALKTKMLFYSTTLGSIMNIILNFILIPYCGAIGAAISTAISYFIVWIIRILNTKNIVNIKIELLKDLIIYLILIVQAVITSINLKYFEVISIVCLIIIIGLKFEHLKKLILNFIIVFKRRFNNDINKRKK